MTTAVAEKTKDDDGRPEGGAPLFPDAVNTWTHLDVERQDPVEEQGYLGKLPIEATEAEIRGRWGGGKYLIKAKDERGKIKTSRSISIAGDPVFVSKVAEERWRRGLGTTSAAAATMTTTPAAPVQAFGIAEMMAFFSAMQNAQAQAEERRRADELAREERRRREEDAAAERRRKDEEAREARRERELAEQRQRDRDFMQHTIGVLTARQNERPGDGGAKAMESFVLGLNTALKIRGVACGEGDGDKDDEDEDEITGAVRGAVRGLVDSIKGATSKDPAPASSGVATSSENVTVTGALGEKLKQFATAAAAKGRDPNTLLESALEVLNRKIDQVPPAAAKDDGDGAADAANGSASSSSSAGAQRVAEAVEHLRKQRQSGSA
jgi:hypothetical protein